MLLFSFEIVIKMKYQDAVLVRDVDNYTLYSVVRDTQKNTS